MAKAARKKKLVVEVPVSPAISLKQDVQRRLEDAIAEHMEYCYGQPERQFDTVWFNPMDLKEYLSGMAAVVSSDTVVISKIQFAGMALNVERMEEGDALSFVGLMKHHKPTVDPHEMIMRGSVPEHLKQVYF